MAKKILFIEDEIELIELVKARLEANNFEVVSAVNGREGLEKVYSEKPDLVLLDLLLPEMDGFRVCQRIKQDSTIKDIPVIVVTASGMKDLGQQCKFAGADDFVKKPYEPAEFIAKINSLLFKS